MDIASYGQAAVELVNTWGPNEPEGEREDLVDVAATRAWMAEHVNWQRRVTADDVARLKAARDRFREIFTQPEPEAVKALNGLLDDYPIHPRISGHDGMDWHVHLAEDDRPVGEHVVAMLAFGLAHVLVEEGFDRRGVCDSSDCDDVYLDTSRNRSRRYCSATCSNRENVAAFRARQREQ